MSNLLSSMSSAANALSTYQKAIEVVQNDTVNSTTPGYVRQTVTFNALPFDVNGSQAGGVGIATVTSSRNEYAERSVQTQQSAYEQSATLASHLSAVEPLFDIQSTTGIAGSLNTLFSAFSQLTVSPNDSQSRQSVINAASGVATAFNVAASGLQTAFNNVDAATQITVTDINNTIADIRDLNIQMKQQSQTSPDPSVDARLHNDLETLAQYTGISTLRAQDGSVSVFLGGQTPLLIGSTQYSLQAQVGASGTTIVDSNGNDLTNAVSGGQLGALVQMRNTLLPSYQSQLDQMAQGVASVMNSQLAAGIDQSGAAGAPLFTFTNGTGALGLSVTSIAPGQIAAATSASAGGNDNAIALSNIRNQTIASLGNFTLTGYIGNLSSGLGRDVSNAQNDQTTQQSLLAQAQTLRSDSSAVSLDEEAARLLEYQRSYQATSKMITVIDSLTQTLLALVPSS